MLFEKPLNGIDGNDILLLRENGVPESRTLEYKQQLPGTTEPEKEEFLRDVSAMANASGGVIVFGIATRKKGNTGIPDAPACTQS